MINLSTDIHSLTDFKRNTSDFMNQIKETGHPIVLTVNGKAELIVQDAASYQKLLDAIDHAEALEGIRRGLAEFERGEGRLAHEAFEEIRAKHGIPR